MSNAEQKGQRWKRLLIPAVAVAAVASGWLLLARLGAEDPAALPVLAVEREVPLAVRATGTVEADRIARLTFDIVGTIARIDVEVGDRVARGQPLAALDDRLQSARVESARASFAEAQALGAVRHAAVDGAVAVLDRRRRTQARTAALRVAGHASASLAEDSDLAVATALADLQGARHSLELALAQAGTMAAQLQVARVLLQQHVLLAPFDGLVISRSQTAGEVTDGRTPVVTVVDPASVWVRAFVGEQMGGSIAERQTAEIVLRGQPQIRLRGRVARLDRETDRATDDRRFYVAFESVPTSFVLGEPAEIRVVTGTTQEAILIPERLIRDLREGMGLVWVRAAGGLAERQVRLGRRHDDGRWELAGGLQPGEQILAVRPRGWLGSAQ